MNHANIYHRRLRQKYYLFLLLIAILLYLLYDSYIPCLDLAQAHALGLVLALVVVQVLALALVPVLALALALTLPHALVVQAQVLPLFSVVVLVQIQQVYLPKLWNLMNYYTILLWYLRRCNR